MADLAAYDELARCLETSQRRKLGLQADIEALQAELRLVEADIVDKAAAAERLRKTLQAHRESHGAVVGHLEDRLQTIDRDAYLAGRPHLRTADRLHPLR